MIVVEAYNAEDLEKFLMQERQKPEQYKRNDVVYTIVSNNEFHLNEFSWSGSVHTFYWNGTKIDAIFEFCDATSRYAGPIVIYHTEDSRYFMCPCFEFESFEKCS